MTANNRTTILQGYIDRLSEGDESYRQRLINDSFDRLLAIVRSKKQLFPSLDGREETGDVLNEASTRLWKSLATIQPRSVDEYFRLAGTQIRRTLVDLVRRHHGRKGQKAKRATNDRRGDEGRAVPDKPDQTHDPAELMEWTEFHQAVETLPEELRKIFDLLYYHGLTQPEAARVLGMPERTLKRRWRDARIALTDLVQGKVSGKARTGVSGDE